MSRIFANKDEAALTGLVGLPAIFEGSGKEHTEALKDKLLVLTLDSHDTLQR